MKKILLFVFLLFPVFVCATTKIDINTASLSQLDELAGIGPKYAQAIINARPFSSIDDLVRVKGIGEKTLQKIKEQGLAYVSEILDLKINSEVVTAAPSGIVINEIMPNPKGADETDEWIELYNTNNSDLDLSGWQIQDISGVITAYNIAPGTKILAKSFLIFKRPDTKIMLNNEQDGINLLNSDKKLADSVNFTSAPLNQSYNRIDSDWQWSPILTPDAENIITVSKGDALPKTNISVKNDGVETGLSNVSQAINQEDIKKKSPWFLFFTVLATTVILATIVLLIKLKFKGKNFSA